MASPVDKVKQLIIVKKYYGCPWGQSNKMTFKKNTIIFCKK